VPAEAYRTDRDADGSTPPPSVSAALRIAWDDRLCLVDESLDGCATIGARFDHLGVLGEESLNLGELHRGLTRLALTSTPGADQRSDQVVIGIGFEQPGQGSARSPYR